MTVGARRAQVRWLFLRDALRVTALGVSPGIGGALAVGTVLQDALVDVRANHPPALLAVSLFLTGAAIAAVPLPARRAARLDPIVTLRHD
jgi:putative ABC transport system permease protein